MSLSIPDGNQTFDLNGEKMTPGISMSNSEVGLASLSIAAFMLRLVCTNGMISKTEVFASYSSCVRKDPDGTLGSLEQRVPGTGQAEKPAEIIHGKQGGPSGEHHQQL